MADKITQFDQSSPETVEIETTNLENYEETDLETPTDNVERITPAIEFRDRHARPRSIRQTDSRPAPIAESIVANVERRRGEVSAYLDADSDKAENYPARRHRAHRNKPGCRSNLLRGAAASSVSKA